MGRSFQDVRVIIGFFSQNICIPIISLIPLDCPKCPKECFNRGGGGKCDLLWKMSRAGMSKRNACRNLHTLIDKNNVLFKVRIDVTQIMVAIRKPSYRTKLVWWPIIHMQDWVQSLIRESPQVLLGGYSLEQKAGWQAQLVEFWSLYRNVNPNHCLYTDSFDHKFCIPYFLHGDEGRGYCRRPYMVESFQPVLGWKGTGSTNEAAYFDCTKDQLKRFCLGACI